MSVSRGRVRVEKIQKIYVIVSPLTDASSFLSRLINQTLKPKEMNFISASDFLTIFFYCSGFCVLQIKETRAGEKRKSFPADFHC
jgi:hypothetical protein